MKIFIMKKGQFLNKETGETTNSLSGRIKAINTETTEDGNKHLVFVFGDPESENTPALRVKLFGDAALKIVRCLFGIFDEIGGKDIVISLTPREGEPAKIGVTADGEELEPVAYIGTYGYDRMNLTVEIVRRLVRSLTRTNVPLLVVHVDERLDLTDEQVSIPDAVARYIRAARAENRSDRYAIAKHCFANGVMRDGYMTAVQEGAVLGRTFWFTGTEDIDHVWLAHVEPIDAPAEEAPEATGDEEA